MRTKCNNGFIKKSDASDATADAVSETPISDHTCITNLPFPTTFFRHSGNDGQKYKPVLCKQQTPCRYFRRVQYFRRFSWWENSIKKKPCRKVLSRKQPRHCSYAALECSEWLPSVSMDPNGLDISEESNIKVPSRLQLAFLLHLQQYGVLCRLYAFPYCTPAAPPHTAYGPAPASSQHAVATSGNPDAPPASVKSRRHATCLWPRLYDSARSRRSSPALAITTASRAVRSLTSAT